MNFPLNLIVRTIPAPNTFAKRPSPDDKVAYGKYMTNAALCTDCHTPIDEQGTPLPGMDFAGGMEFLETGYRVRAANITPDANTGIGIVDRAAVHRQVQGLRERRPTPRSPSTSARRTRAMPMTAYAGMTREDLSAIYAYLRTLKPVTNRVEKFPDAK